MSNSVRKSANAKPQLAYSGPDQRGVMNDSRVQELTEQLSLAIPREGEVVRLRAVIDMPDEDPTQIHIVANRAGFLRLGIACLQAAYAPYAAKDRAVSDSITIECDDLVYPPVRFERSENVSSVPNQSQHQLAAGRRSQSYWRYWWLGWLRISSGDSHLERAGWPDHRSFAGAGLRPLIQWESL